MRKTKRMFGQKGVYRMIRAGEKVLIVQGMLEVLASVKNVPFPLIILQENFLRIKKLLKCKLYGRSFDFRTIK